MDFNTLEYVYKKIQQRNNIIFYGDVYRENENKIRRYLEDINDYFWYKTTLCHQVVFFPTCLIKKYLYDVNYKIASDYDLLLKLYKSGIKFEYLNTTVCIYEGGGFSESLNGIKQNKVEKKIIIHKYFSLFKILLFFIKNIYKKIIKI